jgi:hypothetical protein
MKPMRLFLLLLLRGTVGVSVIIWNETTLGVQISSRQVEQIPDEIAVLTGLRLKSGSFAVICANIDHHCEGYERGI